MDTQKDQDEKSQGDQAPAADTPPITPEPDAEPDVSSTSTESVTSKLQNLRAELKFKEDLKVATFIEKALNRQEPPPSVAPPTSPSPSTSSVRCDVCNIQFGDQHTLDYHLASKSPCNILPTSIIQQGSSKEPEEETSDEDDSHTKEPIRISPEFFDENEEKSDAEIIVDIEEVIASENDNDSITSGPTSSPKSKKSLNESISSAKSANEDQATNAPRRSKRSTVPRKTYDNMSSDDQDTSAKRKTNNARKRQLKPSPTKDGNEFLTPKKKRKLGGARAPGSLKDTPRTRTLDEMTDKERQQYRIEKDEWLNKEGNKETPPWANKYRDPECYLWCQVCLFSARMHCDGPPTIRTHWLKHYSKQFFLQEAIKGWIPLFNLFEDDGTTQSIKCPREGHNGCKIGTAYSNLNHEFFDHYVKHHVVISDYIDENQGLPRSFDTEPNPVAAYTEGTVGPGPEFTQGQWNADKTCPKSNIVPVQYRPFQPFICDGKTVVWKENPDAPHDPENHPQPKEHRDGYKRLIAEYKSRWDNIPRDRGLIIQIKHALDILFGRDELDRPIIYDLNYEDADNENDRGEAVRHAIHELTRKDLKLKSGKPLWPYIWRFARPGYISEYTGILRDSDEKLSGGRPSLMRPDLDPDFEDYIKTENDFQAVKDYVYKCRDEGEPDTKIIIPKRPYIEHAEHKEADLNVSIPSLDNMETPADSRDTVGKTPNALIENVEASGEIPAAAEKSSDEAAIEGPAALTRKNSEAMNLKRYIDNPQATTGPVAPITEQMFNEALSTVRQKILTLGDDYKGKGELLNLMTMLGITDKYFSANSPLAFLKMGHADFAVALADYSDKVGTEMKEATKALTAATNAQTKATEESNKASQLLREWTDAYETDGKAFDKLAAKVTTQKTELTTMINDTKASIASYRKVRDEINKEVKDAEEKLEKMVTDTINKILPTIVTDKVNSLAGEQWNAMLKGLENTAVITKDVRSIEANIAALLETLDKYKGLVELSNDCKLMLKYYDVFRRYWSRLMAYSKICTGLTLDEVFEGEMVVLHVSDDDWNFFDTTRVECVAAEEIIRGRMDDPNLVVDVQTAQQKLLEATEERNRMDRERKLRKEKAQKEAEKKDKDVRHKEPKLSSQVTVVKNVANNEREEPKKSKSKSSGSKSRDDGPEHSKKSTRSRSPQPSGSDTPDPKTKEKYAKKVVKVLLSKHSSGKAFMDTSVIGETEYPLFKERMEEKLEKNDNQIRKLKEEREKLHNQFDSVEERIERERLEKEKKDRERRDRDERRRREEARRDDEQLEEMRRAEERNNERRRSRNRRDRSD